MNTIVKDKLKKGEIVLGTFVKLNSPSVVEMIAFAGFDFIIVDGEHSAFSYPDYESIIRVADGVNLGSVIRLSAKGEEHILHALDLGAGGVQIPSLENVEDALDAVNYTKYYPEGKRGLSFNQRAAKYGMTDKDTYVQSANSGSIVVVHIENIQMAQKIDELCKIPQIDVLFVGPQDLSQSMGKPGKPNDAEVVAVIEDIFLKGLKNGKHIGIYVANENDLKKYIALGAKYFAWKSDVTIFANAAKKAVQEFKSCY